MRIINPFQMNDWAIGKFLKVALAVQLALWGAIGLDAIGLQIPILRQLIGFIYLTFVPGILILRILKLHKLGNIATLLYTVGLSIATLMFTGLFMNTVYPLFGISGPISITPLIITISILVLILCILSYVRDKDFSAPGFIDVGNVLSPPALFLCLIPFLAIFGTYLVNFHNTNTLLMLLIVVIVLVALLIGFDKFIPRNLYPLAVFVIIISLLYHQSLISLYLTGCDIYMEHYCSNLVAINSHWNPMNPAHNYNTMLSIAMLAPIFSIICDMSLTWVFKVIYPLLLSLVPLGLYRAFQKQTNDKIAFLACFFFVSGYKFYTEMLSLAKQEIAQLFLVLLILSMIDTNMNKIKKSFLFIVFGISLAVSHYGTSYIYMFCLISAWLILVLAENPAIQKLGDTFYAKFGRYKRDKLAGNPVSTNVENRTISLTFVLLFIVFALTWYMYVTSSSVFNAGINIGYHIASSIFTDFLNPETVLGLEVMLTEPAPGVLHEVNRIINYLNQIFIIIGVLVLLLKHRELKFEKGYAAFSIVKLGILFACISVPFLASSLNMSRTYRLTLFFLAPFCVIGGITVFRLLSRIVRVTWTEQRIRSSLKVLSVFFVIFLLYSSGFVYQVADGHSHSISISQESMKYGDTKNLVTFYTCWYTPEEDVFSARWLSENRDDTTKVYADFRACGYVLQSYGMIHGGKIVLRNNTKSANGYVYLNYLNVIHDLMPSGPSGVVATFNTTELFPIIDKKNKIYTNGGSYIYR